MPWLTTAVVAYAVLIALGGLMGFITARSVPSLVVSGIIALLVLGAAAWSKSNPRAGFMATAALAFVMIGVMVMRSVDAGRVGPPAMGGIGLSVVMLILLAVGHFGASKASTTTPADQQQSNSP